MKDPAILSIVVCDDEPEMAAHWAEDISISLGDVANISTPDAQAIRQSLAILMARQKAARTPTPEPDDETCFDDVDIAFVDYDLVDLAPSISVTGQELAYLVRCYSNCGLIVVINEGQISRPTFDLRLEPSVDQFADVRISADHLANPGLWTNTFIGYRPWSWPDLTYEVDAYARRIKIVQRHMDHPVASVLGIEADLDRLSQKAVAALTNRGAYEISDVSFRQAIEGGSEMGLRKKDKADPARMARIAAARIRHWFAGLVLPAQDPYMDAPHLVSEYPSLMSASDDLRSWNRTASLNVAAVELGLANAPIGNIALDLAPWTDRPLWRLTEVRNNSYIPEVADPWLQADPRYVFLEDLSKFVEQTLALGFDSKVPSRYDVRYVLDVHSSDIQNLLAAEKQRSKVHQLEWQACDPTLVDRSPANLFAE